MSPWGFEAESARLFSPVQFRHVGIVPPLFYCRYIISVACASNEARLLQYGMVWLVSLALWLVMRLVGAMPNS